MSGAEFLPMHRTWGAMMGVAALALAGSPAAGQTSPRALSEAVLPGRSETPAARLSLPPREARAHAMKLAGITRTALDRRLSGSDLTGSLGFLCGIQPGADRRGGAAARGVDPTGRFVGAKLSLAFR